MTHVICSLGYYWHLITITSTYQSISANIQLRYIMLICNASLGLPSFFNTKICAAFSLEEHAKGCFVHLVSQVNACCVFIQDMKLAPGDLLFGLFKVCFRLHSSIVNDYKAGIMQKTSGFHYPIEFSCLDGFACWEVMLFHVLKRIHCDQWIHWDQHLLLSLSCCWKERSWVTLQSFPLLPLY